MSEEKFRYIDSQGAIWEIYVYDVEQDPWGKKAFGKSWAYSTSAKQPYAILTGDDFNDIVKKVDDYQTENAKDKLRLEKSSRVITEYSWGNQEEVFKDEKGDYWNIYRIDLPDDGPVGYYAAKPSSSGPTRLQKQENSEKKYPYYGLTVGPSKNLIGINNDMKIYSKIVNKSKSTDKDSRTFFDVQPYELDPEDFRDYSVEERKSDKTSLLNKLLISGAIVAAIAFVVKGIRK